MDCASIQRGASVFLNVVFSLRAQVPADVTISSEGGQGGLGAFEALVTPLLDRALRLAGVIAPDRWSAEDAVQNATLKAWRKFDQLRDPARFQWWFLKIVANESISYRRRRWHRVLLRADLSTHAWPASLEADHDVRRALSRLSPADRAVLGVRYLLDMSVDDSARLLGISEPALKARTIRAAARLRRVLGEVRDPYE
jgi:RNA polymerase sigma factor (sigma-70 family)